MPMTITQRDFRIMLDIVATPGDPDTADPLPVSVLTRLRELIPSDAVTFVMLDSQRHEAVIGQEVSDRPVPDEDYEGLAAAFWKHYWHTPHACYPDVSGDLGSIMTMSDFYGERELHATLMYCEFLKLGGSERLMMVCLPSQPGRVLRLLFWRGPGPDFSQRDRDVLTLLRPHLHNAYRDQQRRQHTGPQLTSRQWGLLRLVAAGHTNGQIGRRLSISEATVRKHLEHIFERLQVTSRTAAVSRAFDDSRLPPIPRRREGS
jgi:DNA-binding CsgD family transcriptional regulator